MAGTFWYHPHYHGSSALQVGGGCSGAIVIEDTAQDVPAWIQNIPDQVMMLHNWFMAPDDAVGIVNISGVVEDKLVAPSYVPHTEKPGVEG